MSWKLAEWRWREQAPLRERSLWKIWDVEDAVKNGDVVEETVRLAFHFPDQLDGCWQSRVEFPQRGRLGSIRSGTNPHPPPQSELPELPQHYTSYHPSRSSSALLLPSLEKHSPTRRVPNSISSSLSTLLSRSIGSTPSRDSTPATPQLPTDFLDIRDWNHLALGQEVERNTTVDQLRSSFGLFSKAARDHSSRRQPVSPQYRNFGRANSSAEPLLRRLPRATSQLHKRYKSADFDASLDFSNRVVPWSNLDTVFEDQQYFLKHYFQHEGAVFEVLNPHDSFGEYSAISAEPFSEETLDISNLFHDSASLLIPTAEMVLFTRGKSENDENNTPQAKRNDTPPAKVFQDLPSAHSGIVGHSGELAKLPSLQEMQTMTCPFKNLPPLIDLPRTPARPGAASPALQQLLTEAKAAKERLASFVNPETPKARDPYVESSESPEKFSTGVPSGEFLSRNKQLKELSRLAPQESGLGKRVMVRNSESFFDLGREYRQDAERSLDPVSSYAQERPTSSALDSIGGTVDMYSRTFQRRDSNVLVRDSRDIFGIAISGDKNYTREQEVTGDPAVPATLRRIRQQLSAGQAPETSLPPLPARANLSPDNYVDFPSSEIAEYDNTQSLLNAGRYEPHTAMVEDFEKQLLTSKNEALTLQDANRNAPIAPLPDVQYDRSYDADDFGKHGSKVPRNESLGLGQLSIESDDDGMLATAPYHEAVKAVHNAVNQDSPVASLSQQGLASPGVLAGQDWPFSHLTEDEDVKYLAIGEGKNSKEILGKETTYNRNLGSAEWLAGHGRKGKDTKEQEKEKAVQDNENAEDWETINGSGFPSNIPCQANLQPLFEPHCRATEITNLSLSNLSSFESLSIGKPATLWDPLRKDMPRTHPPLPGTPYKYRLRTDVSSGDQFLLPEYSLPEVGQHSIDSDPFHSVEATDDLPKGYTALISKFSTSTPQQQALGADTSSDQHHSSSPLVSSQGRLKARMTVATEEQEFAEDHVVQELERDEFHGGSGVMESVEDNKAGIPDAESVYSLASVDIIQHEIVKPAVGGGQSPIHVPGTGLVVSTNSSDDVSIRDGMQYGQQVGGIEMSNLTQVRNFSRNFSRGSGNIQPGSSQLSLPFKNRLMSRGRYESDEDLMKRFSTIDNDGSFYGDEDESEDAASLSSVLREHNPVNTRAGTFAKRAIVGAKNNITGTLRGTGMRGTGSSPANFSSDIYDPAMQRHHSYGQLSSGPGSGREAHSDDIVDSGATAQEYLTQEEVKARLRVKGIDESLEWGNVQRNITGVTISSGHAIGAPRAFQIPRTLPSANSFALTKEQPLMERSATAQEVQDRIEMAIDDWNRLRYECPQFPLRDSHLTMKFLKGDPRREGGDVYIRGGISRIDGRIEEQAYCFVHKRREFCTLPSLCRTPLNTETLSLRKKAGRELVWMLLSVPLFGWVILYYIWKQDPAVNVSDELIRWKTKNLVWEMGQEEIEFAGRALAWFGLGFTGVASACLAVLLWALL